MSNRKGGHFDGGGNWVPPYREMSRWQRIRRDVIAYIMLAALVYGFGSFLWWQWNRPDPERGIYQDDNDRTPAR